MTTAKTTERGFPRGSPRETAQERKEREFLQAKLDAALASGPAVGMTDDGWDALAVGARSSGSRRSRRAPRP